MATAWTTESIGLESVPSPVVNKLAVASLLLSLLALGGMFGFGFISVAVFGVGAGHVALQQIKCRGDRGRGLALVSLAICYLMGTWALLSVPSLLFAFASGS
ncbi:DUF4190 domain-containing protein [Tessaracoccus flavus]|uniref:DUF4190 domain-containing protein n=1 Tax=Tessaracoccus flavus TaxID=1610493 RepID=UPI000897C1AA|nr:DUF4190 domain-containing protein [Tessaracoccus flavus]SDZ21266.1 protein of unknown function [Tessaracoccus flavus]